MHDVFYQYGFDESAGNFQSNNYDRGGIANDYVVAQAMDGGGTNNANFYTPPDGSLPRMQMYLWSGPVSMTVQSPQAIEGSYHFATASFGQGIFEIENEIVLANDGSTQPSLGCNVFTNAAEIAGKIAMVDRGNCEFGQKCLNAQNAGAIAVIVCNNVPGNPFVMGAGTFGHLVDIPCVMMSKEDCDSIKIYLDNPVEISMEVGHPVDGDFDDGIICHEYGHGISNRLTGGAGQTNCLNNEEQMGEGWSDWFALMMTMENDDDESRARGMGTYAKNQSVSGPGIRAYKYSTDVSVNPHTYQSIVSAVAPHGVGSVWCAMLWELTWALIREHGYDSDLYRGNGGNNKALALVVEALKLQPCNPGFVDGRNAILLADSLLFNGENNCLIWKSFAKRGLGFSATQGSPFSKSDGQEAFDMPSSCCLQVSNANNDGIGSLRQAMFCAENGDTITFLNFIKGDTIKLINSPLVNQKVLSIKAMDQNQVFVQSMGAFSVFNNENQLILENISLSAGTGSSGRIITNQGNLRLKNTKLIDPLLQSNNGESILNTGHIFIEEEVELTDD